jgi:hypothetical protein
MEGLDGVEGCGDRRNDAGQLVVEACASDGSSAAEKYGAETELVRHRCARPADVHAGRRRAQRQGPPPRQGVSTVRCGDHRAAGLSRGRPAWSRTHWTTSKTCVKTPAPISTAVRSAALSARRDGRRRRPPWSRCDRSCTRCVAGPHRWAYASTPRLRRPRLTNSWPSWANRSSAWRRHSAPPPQ